MRGTTGREFLGGTAAGIVATSVAGAQSAASGLDFPLEDYHVHLNNMTMRKGRSAKATN